MKTIKPLWIPLSLATLVAVVALVSTLAGAGPGKAQAAAGAPVLVELFTSQGCSSCPSADRLLSRLAKEPGLAGRVIPLSFHVDYWNYIGWQDPFSSQRWSGRQQSYARAFRSNRVYTPQMVVNGSSDCVGSDEGQVMQRIRAALAAPPPGQLALRLASAGGAVKVGVDASLAAPGAKHDLDVVVALYETGLSTPVERGENASRTLRNDYVVRRLEKAFTLPAAGGSKRSGEVTLPVDGGWKRSALGVAAFLQDPVTLQIYGAAARPLTAAAAAAPAAGR